MWKERNSEQWRDPSPAFPAWVSVSSAETTTKTEQCQKLRILPSSSLFLSSPPSPAIQQQPYHEPCMSWLGFFSGLVFCQVTTSIKSARTRKTTPVTKTEAEAHSWEQDKKKGGRLERKGLKRTALSHQQWPLDCLNCIIQRSWRLFHFSITSW